MSAPAYRSENGLSSALKILRMIALRSVIQGVIRNAKEEPTKELLEAALAVADEIAEDLKELEGNTP